MCAERLESSPVLEGQCVAFTGTLATMTHRQAAELTAEHGGTASETVTRATTMLVVGEQDCPLDSDGTPTHKLRLFFDYQLQRQSGQLLTETQWLTLLGLHEQQQHIRKLYTTMELSRLLDVPATEIRRWERQGLLRPVKRIHRLSYFDFAEVNVIRRLHELLGEGVGSEQLKSSLQQIRRWLPQVERPLSQLDVLVQNRTVFYRDAHSLVETRTGQRCLDFPTDSDSLDDDETDLPVTLRFPDVSSIPAIKHGQKEPYAADVQHQSAAHWCGRGMRLLAEDRFDEAISAFRMALLNDPYDADIHFDLADALYRSGRLEAATERYFVVLEQDRTYVEAWRQLGCVFDELGEHALARNAFEAALDLHPEYWDVHALLAILLDHVGDSPAAHHHWQILAEQGDGEEWTDIARQRLAQSSAD